MRRLALCIGAIVAVIAQSTGVAGDRRDQAATFRAAVDAVRVDVLVTDAAGIVSGLQASDFEVFDNGVRQTVELVSQDELPLNIVLALDTSGSVTGERLANLRVAAGAMVDALRPDDRLGLLTFGTATTVRARLSADREAVRRALVGTPESGATALVDASYAALMMATGAYGRSLAIVLSDGIDTASFLPPSSVIAATGRTDVVVYAVTTGAGRDAGYLNNLTAATGGRTVSIAADDAPRDSFLAVFDEFRRRYLISFTPRGVEREGWHRLTVRVRGRRVVVRARAGYFAQ